MEQVKNYITPKGYAKIREELDRLIQVDRPETVEKVTWAAGLGDRSENADYQYGKRRLKEIDSRIRFLNSRLDQAVVVNPINQKSLTVVFGASVTVLTE